MEGDYRLKRKKDYSTVNKIIIKQLQHILEKNKYEVNVPSQLNELEMV